MNVTLSFGLSVLLSLLVVIFVLGNVALVGYIAYRSLAKRAGVSAHFHQFAVCASFSTTVLLLVVTIVLFLLKVPFEIPYGIIREMLLIVCAALLMLVYAGIDSAIRAWQKN